MLESCNGPVEVCSPAELELNSTNDNNGSMECDSAVASGESSRRNSVSFREYVRSRRYTMLNRPNVVNVPIPNTSETPRKYSSADSNFIDVPDDLDEEMSPRPLYQRRMSVPEKVFLNSDYAILRPSKEADVRFEIVAAFDRDTDPYRHYMKSLTCYDLQPTHSSVVVIDGQLKIHKALTALSQSGHQAAVVSNLETRGGLGFLTVTDCLRAIIMASEGIHHVAEQTVAQFLGTNKKQLISADANTSIWDAARLIILNGVHRIPIVHYEQKSLESKKSQGDLLYILSLKTVFLETIIKLSDPKLAIGPHIKQRRLQERKLGTWNNIVTLPATGKVSEAINLFLQKKICCVPVVDENGRVITVLSKADVMNELINHPQNYLEVLDMLAKDIISDRSLALAKTTMTVMETIAALVKSDRQSLIVIDIERRPIGVISYSDIMDYIQNSSDVHHKLSLA